MLGRREATVLQDEKACTDQDAASEAPQIDPRRRRPCNDCANGQSAICLDLINVSYAPTPIESCARQRRQSFLAHVRFLPRCGTYPAPADLRATRFDVRGTSDRAGNTQPPSPRACLQSSVTRQS